MYFLMNRILLYLKGTIDQYCFLINWGPRGKGQDRLFVWVIFFWCVKTEKYGSWSVWLKEQAEEKCRCFVSRSTMLKFLLYKLPIVILLFSYFSIVILLFAYFYTAWASFHFMYTWLHLGILIARTCCRCSCCYSSVRHKIDKPTW